MSSEPTTGHQIILCWPADQSDVKRINNFLETDERYTPTVADTLTRCDGCYRRVWIMQQQLELLQSPFMAAPRKLCLFCVSDVQAVLRTRFSQVNITLGADSARRRTV
jgi:dipeptidase